MTDKSRILIALDRNASFDSTRGDADGDIFTVHGGGVPVALKMGRREAMSLAELLADWFEFNVIDGDAKSANFNTPTHAA